MYWVTVILAILMDVLINSESPMMIFGVLINTFIFSFGLAVFIDNDQSEFFKQVKEWLFVYCFFSGLIKVTSIAGFSYMAVLGG